MHQLPLVLFTICIQAATGLLLFMGARKLCLSPAAPQAAQGQRDYPLLSMWGLFIFSLCASLYHLGKPLNAFYVLQGVGHGSPLSMEVLSIGIFGFLTLVYTLLSWKKNIILGMAMLAAVLLSYSVANVYNIATIPLWHSFWTFIQFFMTVLALGCVGMLSITQSSPQSFSPAAWKRWNTLAIAILLLLAVSTTGYAAWAGTMLGQLPQQSTNMAPWLFLLRIVLQVFSLFLLIISREGPTKAKPVHYLGIMLCIVGSELAGRILFYDFQQVSGMLQIFAY